MSEFEVLGYRLKVGSTGDRRQEARRLAVRLVFKSRNGGSAQWWVARVWGIGMFRGPEAAHPRPVPRAPPLASASVQHTVDQGRQSALWRGTMSCVPPDLLPENWRHQPRCEVWCGVGGRPGLSVRVPLYSARGGGVVQE